MFPLSAQPLPALPADAPTGAEAEPLGPFGYSTQCTVPGRVCVTPYANRGKHRSHGALLPFIDVAQTVVFFLPELCRFFASGVL